MKTIAATKLAVVTLVTSVIVLLSSCRNDFDFDYAHGNATKDDIAYNDRFNELIGDIDPNHTWSTATSTQVYYDLNKTFDGFANIYSVSEKSSVRYFLGQIPVENGIITGKFDRPSTTSTIYFEAVDKDGYINKTGYVALDDLYQDATRSADFGMYGITRATRSADDISVASGSPFTATHTLKNIPYTWEEAVKAGDQTACKFVEIENYPFKTYGTACVFIKADGSVVPGFVGTNNYWDASKIDASYSVITDNDIWNGIINGKACHLTQFTEDETSTETKYVTIYVDTNGKYIEGSAGENDWTWGPVPSGYTLLENDQLLSILASSDPYKFLYPIKNSDGQFVYEDINGTIITGENNEYVGQYNWTSNVPEGYTAINQWNTSINAWNDFKEAYKSRKNFCKKDKGNVEVETSETVTKYALQDLSGKIIEGTANTNQYSITTPSGWARINDEALWTNLKNNGTDKVCKQGTIENYAFDDTATGYGYMDINGTVIDGSVGKNSAILPNGYVEIDGNSKKSLSWTAKFAHLSGIEREIDAPHTLGTMLPIVGKEGYLYEGNDRRVNPELKPDVNLVSKSGPLDITFRYGATDHYDKFGYYFWKDGEDPLKATRYILMEDARPDQNIFLSEDTESKLGQGMSLKPMIDEAEGGKQWATPDTKLYGYKYHVPYTEDGIHFTYDWPEGVNVAFVMLSKGTSKFIDDSEMLTYAFNSVRSHNNALGQYQYAENGAIEGGAYHAATIKVGSKIVFGFEDNLEGQGDKDLNDIIFFVDGVTTSEEVPVIPPADPEPITTSYTVKYLDVDTNEEIATTKTVSDKAVGETAYESAISITDYTFNKSSVNGAENSETNRSITLVDGTNEIIFYYKKNSTPPVTPTPTTGNYVVHHYIKGTETKLFEDESGSGNVGSNVDVRAKSKDGYTFDTSKVGDHGELHNAVETITIIDGTIVVIFYYTPITYQSYIIACEDLGNSATSDFDYNDIVFEIVPMRDQKKVLVRPLAEGGTMEAYILFDPSGSGNFSKVKKIGPSGKEEVHKWLTGNASQSYKEMLNTGKSAVHNNAEAYEIVDESGNISMASNWDKYFCVLVNKDGSELTGTEVSYDSESVVFSKNSASAAPRLLCISDNNWLWMQERVKIDEAYPNFCKWAANAPSSTEWYKEPITSQDLYNFVTRRTVVEQVEEPVEETETPNAANTVLTISAGSTQTAITDPTEPTTVTEGEYPLGVESVSTNSRAMAPEWSFYIRENSDLANVNNGNILHIGKNEGSTQIFTLVAKYGDQDITSCKIRVAGEDGSALWAGEISPNGGWPGTKIDLNTTVLAHAMPSSEIWIYYKNGTDGNYLNIQYGTNPEYNQYGSFNWKKDAKNNVLKINLNNNIITYLKSHPYLYFQGEQNKYIITKVELK